MCLFRSPGYHLRERDNILGSLKAFVPFTVGSKWYSGLAAVLSNSWGWGGGRRVAWKMGILHGWMLCLDTEETVLRTKQWGMGETFFFALNWRDRTVQELFGCMWVLSKRMASFSVVMCKLPWILREQQHHVQLFCFFCFRWISRSWHIAAHSVGFLNIFE